MGRRYRDRRITTKETERDSKEYHPVFIIFAIHQEQSIYSTHHHRHPSTPSSPLSPHPFQALSLQQ